MTISTKLAILRALRVDSWQEVIARVSCVRNMPERLKVEAEEPPKQPKSLAGQKDLFTS